MCALTLRPAVKNLVLGALYDYLGFTRENLSYGSIDHLHIVEILIASRVVNPNITIVKAEEKEYGDLISRRYRKFTSSELVISTREGVSLLWNVSFLILKSEIRGDLPEVILSLSDSHELQALPNIYVPAHIEKSHWHVTLAHNVFMPVKEVP